ncbi:MAG: adenosine kinase, partial [Alphaproteobacteria bacterium]
MPDHEFDALCIGNAIVDVMARTEDDFLVAHELIKGTMHLIDAERAAMLYDAMGPAIEASGGSAGNTAAGIASLGGNAAFVGKVADDTLGAFYRHDMTAAGISFDTVPLLDGAPTARSMILITPDGERTMNTYLGACQELAPVDIDRATVSAARVTYMEGYLWDPPAAKQAFRQAAVYAHDAGRLASITLSDPFCVDRFREEYLELLRSGTVDIVFANDSELRSLYKTGSLEAAVDAVRHDCRLSAITVGAEGAIVVEEGGVTRVPAVPTDKVEDLSGA